MYWQPFSGSLANRVNDLETNQSTQQSTISSLSASIISAFYVYGRGSVAGTLINAATRVRLPLPAIGERLPNDTRWLRGADGVISYDGTLAGTYVAAAVVSFQTSLAVLTRYSFFFQEGTGLAASEAGVRDTVPGGVERALAGANTTTCVLMGPLILQPTGGELALRVDHGGISLTLTASEVMYFLHRIDPVPAT